ncbi:TolC family protein [Salinibacter ruber]|uniref:TolC family protein n=1 Tax=Salinibacter ruber TaxID=146919 RepID=UPI0021686CC6|nr:TolC family protein [Salinibacter ruber]MCS3638943.1 cobalt-zinc-cadmium efflux system outer membrane protein [Salinibacter ruber]MCS4099866.1 cobalt-zinc-cadmium efflux system outer membrane protein [Salinibacter ruber]MCS4149153.1 cobalt-zinc-cadmium efflux system outer membrane protein [Salinibacter ruber]
MSHISSRIAVLFVAVVGLLGTTAPPADAQPGPHVSSGNTSSPNPTSTRAQFVQAADSLRTVGLREALRLFRENNLSLSRAQSEAQALRGEARQARAYPNPTLQATHEPLWRGAESQSETYLNVSQQIEWSGRSARIRSARERAAAARAQAAADSARLALQVTEAYVKAAIAETRLQRLRRVTRVFRQADSSMARRRREGDASGYAARRIRLERARYEQRLAAARLEVRNAREQLALLVLPEGTPSVAAKTLPSKRPPAISERKALQAALQQRPELRRWQTAVEAQQAARRAARQEAWPDPSVTAGYKRQSDGFKGAFLGVGIPLPLFDRNRGTAEAEAERLDAARTQQSLARREIRNEVRRAHAAYTSARRQAELLGDDLLRGTGDLLRIAQTSYGEGEMSLVELLDAADAYRDARLTSIDLRSNLWSRYFRLLRAMGRPLDLP